MVDIDPTASRVRSDQETLEELVENLDVLRIGIEAYRAGRRAGWRIVSARLHLLLCDRTGPKIPLALRVIPTLRLHPMKTPSDEGWLAENAIFWIPIPIHVSPKRMELKPFDLEAAPIAAKAWTQQTTYVDRERIKIQDVITLPRHKAGGVHFDNRIQGKQLIVEQMFGNLSPPGLSFRDLIVTIGEYVTYCVENQLIEAVGNGHLSIGETDKAVEFFEFGLSKAIDYNDESGRCRHLLGLAWTAALNEDHLAALDYTQEALDRAESIGDQPATDRSIRSMIGIYNNLGSAKMVNCDYEDAMAFFRKGLSISLDTVKIDHTEEIRLALLDEARILLNIAKVYRLRENNVKAICLAWGALTIAGGVEPFDEESEPSNESLPIVCASAGILHRLNLNEPDNQLLVDEAVASFETVVKEEYGEEREFEAWEPNEVFEFVQVVDDWKRNFDLSSESPEET